MIDPLKGMRRKIANGDIKVLRWPADHEYPSMPSNAGYATWRQQMKVANRLLAAYGTSPWGCA